MHNFTFTSIPDYLWIVSLIVWNLKQPNLNLYPCISQWVVLLSMNSGDISFYQQYKNQVFLNVVRILIIFNAIPNFCINICQLLTINRKLNYWIVWIINIFSLILWYNVNIYSKLMTSSNSAESDQRYSIGYLWSESAQFEMQISVNMWVVCSNPQKKW